MPADNRATTKSPPLCTKRHSVQNAQSREHNHWIGLDGGPPDPSGKAPVGHRVVALLPGATDQARLPPGLKPTPRDPTLHRADATPRPSVEPQAASS